MVAVQSLLAHVYIAECFSTPWSVNPLKRLTVWSSTLFITFCAARSRGEWDEERREYILLRRTEKKMVAMRGGKTSTMKKMRISGKKRVKEKDESEGCWGARENLVEERMRKGTCGYSLCLVSLTRWYWEKEKREREREKRTWGRHDEVVSNPRLSASRIASSRAINVQAMVFPIIYTGSKLANSLEQAPLVREESCTAKQKPPEYIPHCAAHPHPF